MEYLFYKKETDIKAKVILTYSVIPPDYMLSDGNYVVVDDILPKPELKENEHTIHYINPKTKEQTYEIYTRKKTNEEISQELQVELNAKLLKDNANMQIELDKQKELNSTLLLKIAELGGDINA
ncbi:hypothetical protein FDF50_08350 [Clostridium botulinum]|uniref:Uncharacterized protein n=1 Tax=Clostridium botulinum TaxID=1491 RepID=A0A6G4HQN9_CLOBO|nr:hypothetical protein [Clostridium botulinum]MBO0571843.1 hypothetical protein [Clostridium botulinum]NFJ61654.1 hypothetical protein [Clostridium botulinum]NFQ62495.1 hypothetical protein [Clostridium botulinum]NFR17717.1 hypothetical protein [Clostridium botulinum]NFU16762.1 hypothetical protein [Clostridium botulinum]